MIDIASHLQHGVESGTDRPLMDTRLVLNWGKHVGRVTLFATVVMHFHGLHLNVKASLRNINPRKKVSEGYKSVITKEIGKEIKVNEDNFKYAEERKDFHEKSMLDLTFQWSNGENIEEKKNYKQDLVDNNDVHAFDAKFFPDAQMFSENYEGHTLVKSETNVDERDLFGEALELSDIDLKQTTFFSKEELDINPNTNNLAMQTIDVVSKAKNRVEDNKIINQGRKLQQMVSHSFCLNKMSSHYSHMFCLLLDVSIEELYKSWRWQVS